MPPRRQRFFLTGLCLVATLGCHRGAPSGVLAVRPPFSERAEVLWLWPRWQARGDEIELVFDGENRLHTPLYVRLAQPRLLDGEGRVVARDGARLECRLMPGRTPALLRRLLTRPVADGGTIAGAAVDALAIPLADPGRSLYREWAWLRRPREVQAIDTELRAYDALPECSSAPAPGA